MNYILLDTTCPFLRIKQTRQLISILKISVSKVLPPKTKDLKIEVGICHSKGKGSEILSDLTKDPIDSGP